MILELLSGPRCPSCRGHHAEIVEVARDEAGAPTGHNMRCIFCGHRWTRRSRPWRLVPTGSRDEL